MKKLTKLACLLVGIMMFAAMFAVTPAFADEPAETYSAKTYVPEAADFVNYWGGVGDLSEDDGDGIFTFAHAAFTVPMKGAEIKMNTLFKLLSKKSVADGGDGIDGWVTYSFSKQPGGNKEDNTFPYYSGAVDGIFLHITNYSGTTAPNCVEVQVVKRENGEFAPIVPTFFLDNAVNVPMTLSLVKAENGKYTLTFTKIADGTVLKKVEEIEINEALFVNEKGQTFFSTAIYEADGCDGQHWLHRGVAVFSAEVYTPDLTNAVITLEQTEYEFDETVTAYKPAVTVKFGEKTLENNVDYFVTYKNNKEIGTAEVIVAFIGEYAGNASKTVTFEIKEKENSSSGDQSSDTGSSGTTTGETSGSPSDNPAEDDGGCTGAAGISAIASVLGMAVVLVAKKRA